MRTPLLLSLVLGGCLPGGPPDSCIDGTKKFTTFTFDDASPPSETSTRLDVRFTAPPRLPEAFYDGGMPGDGVTRVDLVEANHLRFELPRPLSTGAGFAVRYPDPRYFIDCNHPGMDDITVVSFSVLKIAADGGYRLEVTEQLTGGNL